VDELFAMPVTKPKMMLADKGYDGDEVRTSLLMRDILPVIPPKASRKEPIACDFQAYKDRNRIKRIFNRSSRPGGSPLTTTRLPRPSSACSTYPLTPLAEALCQQDRIMPDNDPPIEVDQGSLVPGLQPHLTRAAPAPELRRERVEREPTQAEQCRAEI
jgi:hypothetical protein